MKKLFSFFVAIALVAFTNAQELPQESPAGSVMTTVGLTDISIDYSRPGVKGRTVFGDMLPYGEMWRTGANKATAITFSSDVSINGTNVPAGSYSIFTIPGEDNWTVILNKETNLWGTGGYNADLDVVRFDVKPMETVMTETMTFDIANVTFNGCDVVLSWEKTMIAIPVKVDYMAMAQENIDSKLKEMEGAFSTYRGIANFYIQNNMELEKALEFAQKSVDMKKVFWNVKTLAEAQAANGMYKEAIKTAEESMALAKEAGNMAYVNMNQANIDKWKKMK